jgi:hypothetical protein
MKADALFGGISMIVVDVVGRDVAFTETSLTAEQLRTIRERIDTMISMNLPLNEESKCQSKT